MWENKFNFFSKDSAVDDPQVVIRYSCGFEVGESCIFKNVDGSTYEWTRAIDSTVRSSKSKTFSTFNRKCH